MNLKRILILSASVAILVGAVAAYMLMHGTSRVQRFEQAAAQFPPAVLAAKDWIDKNGAAYQVVDYSEKTWPDACLGFYDEGSTPGSTPCLPPAVHGYEVWFFDPKKPDVRALVHISTDGANKGSGGDVPVEYLDLTGPHIKEKAQ
jgi:hypothetical protein